MKNLILAGVVGTVIGLALAVVVQLVARAAGVDFIVDGFDGEREEVGLGQTIPFTILGGFLLTILALALSRRGSQGPRLFLGIATVLLVLSFYSPFDAAETTGTAISLSLMHVAAAIGIVGSLARRLRREARLSA